jgi:hypothetical protein
MPESAIDQAWNRMKHIARREAKRLVDDFPNHDAETLFAPVAAEEFCELASPINSNDVTLRQMALSMLINSFDNTRLSINARLPSHQMIR